VWEMPLYHRSAEGQLVCRHFRHSAGGETVLSLNADEQRVRGRMVACYSSQRDLSEYVFGAEERFRPQAAYDYALPPHPGTLNYEAWQWPIAPAEVSRRFTECLADAELAGLEREAPPAMLSATAGASHAGSAT
jgi:hypothetical protein